MMVKGTRVELVTDQILAIGEYGHIRIEVSTKNPCKGTITSTRYRKFGKTSVKMITFAPDQHSEAHFELTRKNFRELKEE